MTEAERGVLASPPKELTVEIVQDRLLLVEGPGDVGFFRAMFHANRRSRIQLAALGGEGDLRVNVAAALRTTGFRRLEWLGIAFDADKDAQAQFESALNAMRSLKPRQFALPDRAWTRAPRINEALSSTIIVLPDGVQTGDRERYVWERSLAIHPVAACIEASFDCMMNCGIDKSGDWKARVNTLLHALRPRADSRPNAERNGELLFEITANADYADILNLIPADDEEI